MERYVQLLLAHLLKKKNNLMLVSRGKCFSSTNFGTCMQICKNCTQKRVKELSLSNNVIALCSAGSHHMEDQSAASTSVCTLACQSSPHVATTSVAWHPPLACTLNQWLWAVFWTLTADMLLNHSLTLSWTALKTEQTIQAPVDFFFVCSYQI